MAESEVLCGPGAYHHGDINSHKNLASGVQVQKIINNAFGIRNPEGQPACRLCVLFLKKHYFQTPFFSKMFPSNTQMVIVATLLLKVNIAPAAKSKWPTENTKAPGLGVQMPAGDLQVILTPRMEFKDIVIDYDFGDM